MSRRPAKHQVEARTADGGTQRSVLAQALSNPFSIAVLLPQVIDVPVLRIWNETPLHVTGCGVAPVITYAIRTSADGVNFSDPLTIGTAHNPEGDAQSWGDITGGPASVPPRWLPPDRVTNFADVGNAIRTFENRTEDTGFLPRVWVDLEIDQVINLADISFVVMAFEGREYTDLDLPLIGIHPAECP